MEVFKLKARIHKFDKFREFAKEFSLGKKDLVLTNRFVYEPSIKDLNLDSRFIIKEDYGQGEPSDEMMNSILKESKKEDFDRIIAVGGGTVLDIAKLLILKDLDDVVDAFEKKIDFVKEKQLIAIPTTCGTGSEVTNIAIAEIKSKGIKMGLAVDELFPDDAVLIPDFLKGLPYKFYVYSSIDALIHAVESYISPKSNPYSKLYSTKAIEMILDIYLNIIEKGENYRFERLEDILIASNYAGIAFGNTGVGAVHALSYPLSGKYHVPHGEANYQFFTEVFKMYNKKNPNGSIKEINKVISDILGCVEEKVYDKLEEVLGKLLSKNKLRSYGMTENEINIFTDNVFETQQRLLANNYVELSKEDILNIYEGLY
ncbi:4-hydroxybutyrate dehydrogenase [Paramaledivibacter caminithermalis]|uniref:4-hydroxybutyrate dehydrogenase n=1 Tax=Paramaledivibacter caminithermalis (strain DSM 15212 / CIP 107654 / DViRD3) TaxID=1121301 RepID=A0A1M6SEJ5_PARC5|nr:4-hydroxybutyrate dehydrogenase [Paramaledivibacter caminithermalis]SHK43163.1 4-hydroxybutyrate dehydrogenase [Paramaledivibacter caminithermalis DSM 15212]